MILFVFFRVKVGHFIFKVHHHQLYHCVDTFDMHLTTKACIHDDSQQQQTLYANVRTKKQDNKYLQNERKNKLKEHQINIP